MGRCEAHATTVEEMQFPRRTICDLRSSVAPKSGLAVGGLGDGTDRRGALASMGQ